MVNGNLPEGWVWTTINEIADFVRGVSYKKGDASETPKDGFLPILRATNIQDDRLITNDDLVFVPEKYVKPEQLLKVGDVVICMSSGSKHLVGKTAQLQYDWQGSFGTFCGGLRFKPYVNSRFGAYYFQSPSYREFIRKKSSGININNLRFADFETLEIPLPPLPEQERIVSRIEELFSDLEAGVAALGRVRAGLKRYKASVLKAAVSGRLVNGNLGIGEVELPEGWRWVTLPEVGYLGRGKSKHRPRNAEFLYGGKYPFIQTGDIRHADGVIKSYTQTYSEAGLAQSKLWPQGTLCITIAANIAETAILGLDACFPDSVVGFIPNEDVDVKFVEYYFRTIRENLERFAPATAQKNINLDVLQKVTIPLPPLEEQRRIVAEVERRLSVVKEVESAVEAGLARAARLRQAILRSAFEGKL